MTGGKLFESALKRCLLNEINKTGKNPKALVGGDAGKCCETLTSVASVTGNEAGVAALSVYRAVNSLAAAGAKAEGITLSLSIPKDFGEDRIRDFVRELIGACEKADVRILDGNAVVTENESLTSVVTAIGKDCAALVPLDENRDKVILMIGNTGTAGAAMIAGSHREALMTRLPEGFVDKAAAMFDDALCAEKALSLSKDLGGRAIMHDVEDGGLFGAVWELCERENIGCELEIGCIPIKQGTIEVSEFFDINPYILRGDGAMLVIAEDTPEARAAGHMIGRVISGKERVVVLGSERRFLEPNRNDDYFNLRG